MIYMNEIGRIIIIFGIILIVIGIVLLFSSKIPFVGKLPGDILIKKDGFTFYFPLVTSIIISIIITIIINLFTKK